jgi:hypothetical protein
MKGLRPLPDEPLKPDEPLRPNVSLMIAWRVAANET